MYTDRIQLTSSNTHKIYTQSIKPLDKESINTSFLSKLNDAALSYVNDKRECEYFKLADNSGVIQYKKATFICDKENNALKLGDCSNERKCIKIKLSKGGSLMVNRDNIDDLLMSIGMFSAKDQGLIMQAVMKDKIAKAAEEKLEENEEVDTLIDDVKANR